VWALGIEGQGVVVAGADTGVRWTHAALKNQYRGWNGTSASHDYNWKDAIHTGTWPPDPANLCNGGGVPGQPSLEPCDDDNLLGGGHGSHTVGSMVGDDGGTNRIGMAPQAKWVACRNMSRGVGAIPSYLECMQWFIAPTKVDGTSPDPSKAPHVINNSWGCVEGCPPEPNPLRDSLRASRAAGIVYVASAGNDGGEDVDGNSQPPYPFVCNSVYHPLARYPEAFTVGSTTHNTDIISYFSSRGPAAADPGNPTSPLYIKPNITAPGSSIRSALRASDTSYGNLSGTSMAGPHVAGLVALVISANPALAGNVDRIEEIIEQTAVRKTTTEMCGLDSNTQVPNNTYGWGRIDALAAVQEAISDIPSGLINYALTTRGSVPLASSTYTSRNYSAESAFDGERTGGGWEQGGGWNDNTRDLWPDTLEVTLGGGAKNISEIRVYTLQDNFHEPQEPTPDMMATLYGLLDFDVQYWDGSAWVTVPGGQVRGNSLVLRSVSFPELTTTKIRIHILNARQHFSRIVEVEAFGCSSQ
jgi:subtilisin family serine protease